MPISFSLVPDALEPAPQPRRVLVTGAAGRLGTDFVRHAPSRFDLRLMVRPGEEASQFDGRGEIVEAELEDFSRLLALCEGIDTVLHLAAEPRINAEWDTLLPSNIVGTHNLFQAAKAAGCRRVIFASSVHAVAGYPEDIQVRTSDPVNPDNLYGVTKAFGEALARYMAEQQGLSSIVVRIGAAHPERRDWNGWRMGDAFISYADLRHLFVQCIDDVNVRFAIVHGVSDNRTKRLDISTTKTLLGYRPAEPSASGE